MRFPALALAACLVSLVAFRAWPLAAQESAEPQGVLPAGADGQPLNLDFETGTLDGWTATGNAFEGQPVLGDTVRRRRADMQSRHNDKYWIGTYEIAGDPARGTLTSAAFKATHPWATFLVSGGPWPQTHVEVFRARDKKTIFRTSGDNGEELKYAVVDLRPYQSDEIAIRIVDQSTGGWGHINFDNFRLHAEKPHLPAERVLPESDEYAHSGLSPEEAAKAMSVPEGFQVKLFAGEPDVQQPIALAIDDRGRLWVAEAYSYPARAKDEEARDRILIFEDSDGDGHFDSRKIFAEKLNLVSGLEVGFGGVWVGAAPHFLFIPDRNQDDQPDGPAEVLLDGWGYQDTHETLNAFTWGPDGWLYGCHGVFTHSLVGKPGTPKRDRVPLNAAVWRYHPTRHEFEVFAHGTSNPWGVDFDDHGECFITACVIPHLYHMTPGGRYQRQAGTHFNPHTYDDIKTIADHLHWVGGGPHAGNGHSHSAGGGHAHSGAMIYQGGAWPDEYRGRVYMNNIHGARINVDVLEPKGASYVGHHGKDFVLANDRWSQILNMYYGPDGQVYMLDWYDQNQCHHNTYETHDRSNGRIFKVVYGDKRSRPVDVAALSDLQLVDLLLHKNEWFVRHARRLLQERARQGALSPVVAERLVRMAFEHPEESRRLRGLWALYSIGQLSDELIDRGFANDGTFVRAWSVRLAAADKQRVARVLPKFAELAAGDPAPIVRKYLAGALENVEPASRWDILAALTAHGEDATEHELPLLYWYELEPLFAVDAPRALELAVRSPISRLAEFAARRVASEAKPAGLAAIIDQLGQADDWARQLALLTGTNQGLKGRRRVARPENWSHVGGKLAASPDENVRNEAQALAVTLGDPAAFAAMRALIANRQADLVSRRSALASLLGARDEQLAGTMQQLIGDPQLRADALRGLAAYDDPQTPGLILAAYGDLNPVERRDALATLAARADYASALLDAVADKRIATGEISADVIRQLRNLDNAALDDRIKQVWGEVRDTGADAAQRIAHYKALLSKKPEQEPDVELGRAVFVKTCQQCHTLFGVGSKIGPELTGSNRANLDYVLSNVLDPSSLIAKDYMATVVATTDGRVLTGIVRSQDDQQITLATATETVVLPRDEIDQVEASNKSMMPDDIWQPLSEHEIRSLIAYLASPAQTALLATPETLKTFFNGVDLAGWTGAGNLWSVDNGEVVGRSPGLDHNEFLVSDLAAGDFRLRFQVKITGDQANSGVQFRSKPIDGGEVQGYQADIGVGWWGKLYEEHGRAILWDRSGEEHVRAGDWNDYEIVASGTRVRTYINGQLCVDLDDPAGARRGVFALQLHAGPPLEVRYRNFQLELDPRVDLAAEGQ